MQQALSFNGSTDFIQFPEAKFDFSGGLTIEAWVKYETVNTWSRVIDFGNGAAVNNIVLCNFANTNDVSMYVFRNTGEQHICAAGIAESGHWIHLAGTIDSAGTAVLYCDGVAVQTGEMKLPTNVNRKLNYAGKDNWGATALFHGLMADIRLWNRALDADEIDSGRHTRLLGNEPGLVGYWPLNEGEGTTAHNIVDSSLNGTICGSAEWVSAEIPLYDHQRLETTGLGNYAYWWTWKQDLSLSVEANTDGQSTERSGPGRSSTRRGRIWS